MGFFSALKMAMLGLVVVVLLSPASGMSFFKKIFAVLVGLLVVAAAFREKNNKGLFKPSVHRHVH